MAGSPHQDDGDECVSKLELQKMLQELNANIIKSNQDNEHRLERIERSVASLVTRMENLEKQPPNERAEDFEPDGMNQDEYDQPTAGSRDPPPRPRSPRRRGMGGNNDYNPRADNPYAKVKFSIPSFSGSYEAEVYLNWEMTVEQKFNAHLVPEIHRVRQATIEFTDFAIIWWNELVKAGLAPDTWDRLKRAMRSRFVPPTYKRDMRKKLQRLNQGNKSVEEYYQELQIGMLRCEVVEDEEDKMARFFGGLRREIQDIVDYKDYNSLNRLF